ncbi:MAG: hypothetical protein EXS37_11495 [Opitutus sp.]|nr:hypothetical protein [Opitutus sp.]
MFSATSQPALQRRFLLLGWVLLAAIPVIYIGSKVVAASRNIVFWDEFDTALALILRINAGAEWPELLQRFFAMNNEHRTVTSRLIFAISYWLTGTVNFHVIGAIGNLFLVGACATLILAVRTWERRIRLGVVLAFLVFQLENFENFIWSGASIDHFQVVMLGVVAIAALAHGTGAGCILAGIFGLLATFTLAQGSVVWPAGALLLWHQRRWNQLAGWCAGGGVAIAAFLHGFEFNPGHNISEITLQSITHVVRYWLALLGGPLTLGDAGFAPFPGLVLLAGFGVLVARGALAREPALTFSAFFAMGSLALVAFGRSELAGAEINSRYMVLGGLAWAVFVFLLVELGTQPEKPLRLLLCLLPALVAFNVSANVRFAPKVEAFVEMRDRAATRFKQYGEDGRGISRLHPQLGHADVMLKMAQDRGVYQLPRVSDPVRVPAPKPSTRIITHVDELIVNDRALTVGGWAMIPGRTSNRGDVHLVLRSEKSFLVFTALTLQRPDVATAYKEPKWRLAGFRAVIRRTRLPAENFEVGVLITGDDEAEFIMTPNRLDLTTPGGNAVRPPGAQ